MSDPSYLDQLKQTRTPNRKRHRGWEEVSLNATESVAINLENIYCKLMGHLIDILKILHLEKQRNDQTNWPLASVALTKAAYYAKSALEIDWKLIDQHWALSTLSGSPPSLSDSEFAELQRSFLLLRCGGDEFASEFIRGYEHLSTKWLQNGGWAKALNAFLTTLPVMVVSIYPDIRKYEFGISTNQEESFCWSLLLQRSQEARLTMLDVFAGMCIFQHVENAFRSGDDQKSFSYLQTRCIDLFPRWISSERES